MQTSFGRTGISVSRLTFGSMRMEASRLAANEAVRLLEHLYARGVDTLHSSHEYSTYEFFCHCLAKLRNDQRRLRWRHIVKLGAPHFDEKQFSAAKFTGLVDRYLEALGTERLDVVQWLVRHTPNEEGPRLAILRESAATLTDCWAGLAKEGKVGVLTSFPYSGSFARAVLDLPACRGLVTYLNPLELESVPFLDSMHEQGQGLIAIRPLFAGVLTREGIGATQQSHDVEQRRIRLLHHLETTGLTPDDLPSFSIRYCLMHPAVASVILSVSSCDHADDAIAAVERSRVDLSKFGHITTTLRGR